MGGLSGAGKRSGEPLMKAVTSDYSAEYLQRTLSFPEMIWNLLYSPDCSAANIPWIYSSTPVCDTL